LRVRAIPDLAQLADHEFFAEIQEGTALCLSNANRIHDHHVSLTAQKRVRGADYLDGPNDVDWIFYNEILRAREETIYVDVVENDGQHVWHDPTVLDEIRLPFVMPRKDPVLRLVNALSDVGCLLSPALDIIAQIWRPLVLDDKFSVIALREWNVKTLEAMDKRGVLRAESDEAYAVIVNQWLFPLWPFDLRKDPVNKNSLRAIQQRWSPEPRCQLLGAAGAEAPPLKPALAPAPEPQRDVCGHRRA